jgi:hypothetical protein
MKQRAYIGYPRQSGRIEWGRNEESFEGMVIPVSSTIETLERELGEAQLEREEQERSVIRSKNAHEAACAARDEAWAESDMNDPEVEELSRMVYQRRRELYEAIDRLKAAEGKERRIKSRLMYVLPAERRRYLSGTVDEEFHKFLRAVRDAHREELPEVEISIVTENPGELDLRGDSTWRALERLYAGTTRRWVEVRAPKPTAALGMLARQISYYAGGHTPRIFVAGEERQVSELPGTGSPSRFPPLRGADTEEGQRSLARITTRRYLDETTVGRLEKKPAALRSISEIARLYQTLNFTGDEIRWRLEQLVSLRPEVLQAIQKLTGDHRRFSFYEIARAARLLDGHLPDAGVAAEALHRSVERALESGVPLVDIAYMSVTSGKEI